MSVDNLKPETQFNRIPKRCQVSLVSGFSKHIIREQLVLDIERRAFNNEKALLADLATGIAAASLERMAGARLPLTNPVGPGDSFITRQALNVCNRA